MSGAVAFLTELGFMSRCRLEECACKVVTTERKERENNKRNEKRTDWEEGKNDGGAQ